MENNLLRSVLVFGLQLSCTGSDINKKLNLSVSLLKKSEQLGLKMYGISRGESKGLLREQIISKGGD